MDKIIAIISMGINSGSDPELLHYNYTGYTCMSCRLSVLVQRNESLSEMGVTV
jgi:hypothetical protein